MDEAMDKRSMVQAKGDFSGAEGHRSAGSYTITDTKP
jgi:hypothetical protein